MAGRRSGAGLTVGQRIAEVAIRGSLRIPRLGRQRRQPHGGRRVALGRGPRARQRGLDQDRIRNRGGSDLRRHPPPRLTGRGRRRRTHPGRGGRRRLRLRDIGCLEALAGGAALARDAELAARSGRSPWLAGEIERQGSLTAASLAMGAHHGDPASVELLQRSGRLVGHMLATVVDVFNPSLIAVGGGVAEAGDVYLATIRESVYRRSLPLATRELRSFRARSAIRQASSERRQWSPISCSRVTKSGRRSLGCGAPGRRRTSPPSAEGGSVGGGSVGPAGSALPERLGLPRRARPIVNDAPPGRDSICRPFVAARSALRPTGLARVIPIAGGAR